MDFNNLKNGWEKKHFYDFKNLMRLADKKEHSIKFSDFIQMKNPEYVYLSLLVDKTAKNYNSDQMGKMACSMYKPISQRARILEKQFNVEMPVKLAYWIEINKTPTGNDVSFIFVVPKLFLSIAKEKISSIWPNVAVSVVEGIKPFDQEKTVAYSMGYNKNDALSLNTDMRSSSMVNTMLNVIDVLDEGDRIGVFYNFVPTPQTYWGHDYKRAMEKHKNNGSLDKSPLNPAYLLRAGFVGMLDIIQDCINSAVDMFSSDTKMHIVGELKESFENNVGRKLSSSTIKKGTSDVLTTQIAVYSSSDISSTKANANAISVCQSFHAISEDNSLNYKKVKNWKFDPEALNLAGFNRMYCSVAETHNFFQVPNRETLEKHQIKFISVLESKVPEELRQGYIHLGNSIYKNNPQPAYMSTDKNLANLGLVVLGPQGSGKSKFFANYGANVAEQGENLVVFDFIKKCELSDEIASVTPKEKLLIIDLSKFEDLQGFGFNEVESMGVSTREEILDAAQRQTQCTINFINSINVDTEMTSRMRRCIVSACNVVYIHPKTSLRDVVDCLQNHITRHEYLDKIPADMVDEFKDDIYNLTDMDDKDNKGNVYGTKANKLDFLMDRINLLMEDRRLKAMFNKPIEGNINFVEELEKGKVILIKMPEATFPTKFHKNILVTFFMSKLWLSAQIRGDRHDKPLRSHIILDEIFQAPTCYGDLQDILLQARKFQMKFVLSAHFLNKLGSLKECLKASGSSYMFLQGTDKANFVEMAEDLAPYKVDDLLNLERFNAICYIKCDKGFANFKVKLPPPITA